MAFDKRAIIAAVRAQLDDEIATMTRLAREAAEAATHEENKPENDKDMRSTEASYVAAGQAGRARELEAAYARLGALPLRAFVEGEPIEAGALVSLRFKGAVSRCLLVPVAGGRRVKIAPDEGAPVEVQTVTPTSPLGEALIGLAVGDEAEAPTPQGVRVYEIVAVE